VALARGRLDDRVGAGVAIVSAPDLSAAIASLRRLARDLRAIEARDAPPIPRHALATAAESRRLAEADLRAAGLGWLVYGPSTRETP
jgi:hypothetical protein